MAEEAREFTEAILGAAHAVLPEARRIPRRLGWCERPAVRTALLVVLDKKREARRQCKAKHTTALWNAFRAACKSVRAAIDKSIKIHIEEHMAELETSPTPRHEGPVQISENDVGPGREENIGTAGDQGRERRCGETRGTSSSGGRSSSAICSTPSLPYSNHPLSRRYSSGGKPGAWSQIGKTTSLATGSSGDGKLESAGRWLTSSRATQTGRSHPRARHPQHYHASLVRVWRGEEIQQEGKDATNQGALQVVGPIRLQELPRDFTHLPRRESTAEDRRQSP